MMTSLGFEGFRDALARQLRPLHEALQGPDDDWPGLLFVEREGRLELGDVFEVAGLDETGKRVLAEELLPARLCELGATRAAWVVPGLSADAEYLVLVVLGHRAEALLAPITRRQAAPPLLGEWSEPTRASGLFVEPMLATLAAQRPGPPCPNCGVGVGEPHDEACDVERCSVCGGQRLLCGCRGHDPVSERWRGEWPGVDECRHRGWFARRVEDQGWQPCSSDAAGARPDLNRLIFFRQLGYDGLYSDAA
jgi:hypothetical protein